MIRSYIEGNQKLWDRDLALLVFSLHATLNRQTGFTPNRMMLGREVFQPIDLSLGTPRNNTSKYMPVEWVQQLISSLNDCHQLVRERLKSTQERQKRYYDIRKLKEYAFNAGDLIWKIHNVRKKGRCFKLESPQKGPFLVVKAQPPLYTIEDRKGPKVVHHDKLTPYRSDEIPLWIRRKQHALFSDGELDTSESFSQQSVRGDTEGNVNESLVIPTTGDSETCPDDINTSTLDPLDSSLLVGNTDVEIPQVEPSVDHPNSEIMNTTPLLGRTNIEICQDVP